jgi:hypothetical protein
VYHPAEQVCAEDEPAGAKRPLNEGIVVHADVPPGANVVAPHNEHAAPPVVWNVPGGHTAVAVPMKVVAYRPEAAAVCAVAAKFAKNPAVAIVHAD